MVKVRIARPDQVFNLILGILKQNSVIRVTRVLPLSKFGRDPQQDHLDGHSDYIIPPIAAMQPATTMGEHPLTTSRREARQSAPPLLRDPRCQHSNSPVTRSELTHTFTRFGTKTEGCYNPETLSRTTSKSVNV